ncbi:putative calcium-dependent cell adhesion molecule 3, partial [Basidiobolus ranarum]
MSVESNKVKFAYELNMQGSKTETYEKGQTVRFNYGDAYNDKFRSVIVGASVRLNIWEHNEIDTPVPGKYDE